MPRAAGARAGARADPSRRAAERRRHAAPTPEPPADTPENDTPPPADSPAERFEEFCNENPGACG